MARLRTKIKLNRVDHITPADGRISRERNERPAFRLRRAVGSGLAIASERTPHEIEHRMYHDFN